MMKTKRYLCVLITSCMMFTGCGPISQAQQEAAHLSIGDEIKSKHAVLTDVQSGEVLAEKQKDERIYPASMTKIMTVLLAIENLDNLEEAVSLSSQMYEQLQRENASMAGFLPNERVKIKDLIAGALLPSGAEACIGLAEELDGSEAAFVERMNQKAEELHMQATHFANTTGLQDTNHYTTVRDMAVLLAYAVQNDTFRQYFTAESYCTEGTDLHPEGMTFTSTMFSEMTKEQLESQIIEGGKTGYTDEAGLCLASLAKVHGKEYILVTAGASGSHKTEPFHIEDAFEIYERLLK